MQNNNPPSKPDSASNELPTSQEWFRAFFEHPAEQFENLAAVAKARAAQKGLAFALEVAPNVPPVLRGDPRRFRQILDNLIGNAIEFTESGRVSVRVTVRGESDRHNHNLVLMDLQIPEMDGLAATRAIRSGEGGVLERDVPVIALTARAMSGDSEICSRAVMNDYLTKPVLPHRLLAMVKRWARCQG